MSSPDATGGERAMEARVEPPTSREPFLPVHQADMVDFLYRELQAENPHACLPGGFAIWNKFNEEQNVMGAWTRSVASLQSHWSKRLWKRLPHVECPGEDILYVIEKLQIAVTNEDRDYMRNSDKFRNLPINLDNGKPLRSRETFPPSKQADMVNFLYRQLRYGNLDADVPGGNSIWRKFNEEQRVKDAWRRSVSSLQSHWSKRLSKKLRLVTCSAEKILFVMKKLRIAVTHEDRDYMENYSSKFREWEMSFDNGRVVGYRKKDVAATNE